MHPALRPQNTFQKQVDIPYLTFPKPIESSFYLYVKNCERIPVYSSANQGKGIQKLREDSE